MGELRGEAVGGGREEVGLEVRGGGGGVGGEGVEAGEGLGPGWGEYGWLVWVAGKGMSD